MQVLTYFYQHSRHISRELDLKQSTQNLNQCSAMECRYSKWWLNPVTHTNGPALYHYHDKQLYHVQSCAPQNRCWNLNLIYITIGPYLKMECLLW